MKALIVVDVQNDFLPGGALAVPDGDAVVAPINRLIALPGFDLVVATQDWHPADHGSFAANHEGGIPGERVELDGLPQVLWPTHCVEGTEGAQFSRALASGRFDAVFQKGQDPQVDSYSGFFDNGRRRSTGLTDYLREAGVTEVWVAGLATDYCVKFTALDAIAEGFRTVLVAEACRGVELEPGDCDAALRAVGAAGGEISGVPEVLLRC